MKITAITKTSSKEKKYSGFETYLISHQFTKEFIKDFEYWCRRIFRNWTLFTEFENFYGICWAALLEKIDQFDPNIATIQTFCISRINNEAWRLYMKNKTVRPEVDCDDEVVQNTLIAKDDKEILEAFIGFEQYASKFGISVNKEELYKDYSEGKDSPGMLAFTYWRAKNNELRGRNDIRKTKRQAANNNSSEK